MLHRIVQLYRRAAVLTVLAYLCNLYNVALMIISQFHCMWTQSLEVDRGGSSPGRTVRTGWWGRQLAALLSTSCCSPIYWNRYMAVVWWLCKKEMQSKRLVNHHNNRLLSFHLTGYYSNWRHFQSELDFCLLDGLDRPELHTAHIHTAHTTYCTHHILHTPHTAHTAHTTYCTHCIHHILHTLHTAHTTHRPTTHTIHYIAYYT